jgi:hypothetical protein
MPLALRNRSRRRSLGAFMLVAPVVVGCGTAVHRTSASAPCPGSAESLAERPPSPDDASGLPSSGPSTHSAAERAIPGLHREFGDVETAIVDIDGRARIRTPDTTVEIGQKKWTIIRVTFASVGACPMDLLSANGVPIFFRYKI